MRKKSITLLICVYAALCISYSVVSSAVAPYNDDLIPMVSQESSPTSSQSDSVTGSSSAVSESENSHSVDDNPSSDETDRETGNESVDTESSHEEELIADREPEEQNRYSDIGTDTSEEISNSYVSEDAGQEQSEDEEEYPEEISDSYVSEDDGQEQLEDEEEYQEDKPSLTDYLSGLRCSGCRHNCTLLSPRCMNGARKASQAESQYDQIYGA